MQPVEVRLKRPKKPDGPDQGHRGRGSTDPDAPFSIGLRMKWASHKDAAYACRHWHYSGSVPVGKAVRVGAWEDGKFIGAIVFSRGAIHNIGRPYGLTQAEAVELTRVALCAHKAPVSRMLRIAIKMLKAINPGLRLLVSYADEKEGHHGGIYQATNWIYTGAVHDAWLCIHGSMVHPRTAFSRYGSRGLAHIRATVDPEAMRAPAGVKHKYLFPLDSAMREKIQPLALVYPKRDPG